MELLKEDVKYAWSRLPESVQELLERHCENVMPSDPSSMLGVELGERLPLLMVAGGFIRACIAGEEPKDIDIFGPADLATIAEEFCGVVDATGYHESENAISMVVAGVQVQFITRWSFSTAAKAIDAFDFTVAQAAIWSQFHLRSGDHDVASVCSERFYPDLAAKRLVYTWPGDSEPGGSMLRLLKFVGRGYRAPLETTAAIIARLQPEPVTLKSEIRGALIRSAAKRNGSELTPQETEDLINEREEAMGVLAILREVDPGAPGAIGE